MVTPTPTGLTDAQARARLAQDGPNELPSARRRNFARIVFDVMREPMLLLLVGCGAVYLLLGEAREAWVLIAFVLVVIGIELYETRKTERALDALRDLSSPRALVVRDGSRKRIAGREVVQGDLMLLSEGDRVATDAVLIDAVSLQIDESLLTGESVPVRKRALAATEPAPEHGAPGGDDTPLVFSGTLVVRGTALARVTATGARTALGAIGHALATIEEAPSSLQRETNALVRRMGVVALVFSALVVLIMGLQRGQWLQGLLSGLAVAMSLLPEEFPVVLTIFLALGAWRMSRRHVLARRASTIETLGAATVLCVDKTGTLTENRMTLACLITPDGALFDTRTDAAQPPEAFHALLEHAVLASHRDPFDPMDRAIRALGVERLSGTEHLHDDWEMLREYPLTPELLAISQAWRGRRDAAVVLATKGAPEAIADLCHLDAAARAHMLAQVQRHADRGLRLLGVARGRIADADHLPVIAHDCPFEWLGLVGLLDPVRADVPAAVRQCRAAGIRVVMITGDYPATASAIAREAGLDTPEAVITGPELNTLDDARLDARIAGCTVFARAVPEHKLRLVRALQRRGEVVAMTGDGVNDAPALRAADIGVAMGARGTDVAREAASLVLVDDAFASIVHAVGAGRRIFDNLRKAMGYVVAVHLLIAATTFLPLVLGAPMVLMPAHIAFLELIIDPACTVVFEAEPGERALMQRAPRDRSARLMDARALGGFLLQGAVAFALVALAWSAARWAGWSEGAVRGATFAALVLGNLTLIVYGCRASVRAQLRAWFDRGAHRAAHGRNRALPWALLGASAGLALVLGVPWLRALFHFA